MQSASQGKGKVSKSLAKKAQLRSRKRKIPLNPKGREINCCWQTDKEPCPIIRGSDKAEFILFSYESQEMELSSFS